jgi:hypothetical protein
MQLRPAQSGNIFYISTTIFGAIVSDVLRMQNKKFS